MTLPVLPRDVFDEIFSQLIDDADSSTLKSYSLVCHSFRRNAQKILFNSIIVMFGDIGNRPIKLVFIVKQAPHLVEYVQYLQIIGEKYRPIDIGGNATDLANALGIFSRKGPFPINLRSLWLENLTWSGTPPGLQDALVLLTAVHSLRDISMEIEDCPASLVAKFPPLLKSLSLLNTTFRSLPTTRKLLPNLESFTVVSLLKRLDQFPGDAMERIVNMTQLKTFRGGNCYPASIPVIERILRTTYNSLEHLILRFN